MSDYKYNPLLLLVLMVVLLMSVSGNCPANGKPLAPGNIDSVVLVTAEEAIDLILSETEMVIIDSRTQTEYAKGHIEGAINIANFKMTRDALQQVVPDRGLAILFYCNGEYCLRSADSIDKAKSWGYTNIFWFRGGWREWTDKHLPAWTD